AAWKLAAEGLLLQAIAAQGRVDDAVARIASLTAADPRAIVPIIDSLDRQAATAPEELRRNLAKVELRLMDLALRDKAEAAPGADSSKLDAEALRRLELLRGSAMIAAGEAEAGVAALKRLAEQNPRDGQAQETL